MGRRRTQRPSCRWGRTNVICWVLLRIIMNFAYTQPAWARLSKQVWAGNLKATALRTLYALPSGARPLFLTLHFSLLSGWRMFARHVSSRGKW